MTKIYSPAIAKPKSTANDAIAVLQENHVAVTHMFAEYQRTHSNQKKNKNVLLADIFTELNVQAQIEEEIFYPAIKAALKGKQLEPKITVGRTQVKDLIAQLERTQLNGEKLDTKVKELSRCVEEHFNEQQSALSTQFKTSSIDLIELGARMAARKDELWAVAA